MHPFDGQLLLALTCVAVAVAVLARRFVSMVRNTGKGGCRSEGCGGCPSKLPDNEKGFVSLDIILRSAKTDDE